MGLEIEVKMQAPDHQQVVAALQAASATPVARLLEINTYLDTPNQQLRAQDAGLRVRVERNLDVGRQRVILTHKGPKHPGEVKTREENELDVSSADDALALLAALGYQPVLRFEKRRDRWKLDDCLVELDTLPALGTFIEIEGPSEAQVRAVRDRLGLGSHPLISRSYLGLLVDKIAAGDLSEDQLTFGSNFT